MPRESKPRRDRRSLRWVVQLGPRSDANGRSARVILRHEDGTPVRIDDEAGAYAAYARLLAARKAEEERRAGPTVGDLIVGYIDWHKAVGSKPNTIETHTWHLTKFAEFAWGGVAYEDRPATSIGVADWTRYRKAMEATGAQTGYVKLAFASVAAMWRWAARPVEDREPERLLAANPFEGLARPRKGRGRKLVLPWATIAAVVQFAEEWTERPAEGSRNRKVAINRERERNRLKMLALKLIAESGCRPHEAAEMRWEWVQFAHRVAVIPEEYTKTHKERIIPLSPELTQALSQLQDSGRAHPIWVIAKGDDDTENAPDPHKLAEWFSNVRAAARRAGIDLPKGVSLYTMRHSLVTEMHQKGMDLGILSMMMGHSRQVAESSYAHVQWAEIRDIGDRVRRMRAGEES